MLNWIAVIMFIAVIFSCNKDSYIHEYKPDWV